MVLFKIKPKMYGLFNTNPLCPLEKKKLQRFLGFGVQRLINIVMYEHLKLKHVGNMDFMDSLQLYNRISQLIVAKIHRLCCKDPSL